MRKYVRITPEEGALVHHRCGYTKEAHDADLGSLHIPEKEKQYVAVPVWGGVQATAARHGALLVRRPRRA